MSKKNLLTLVETANALNLSLTTIRRWSASGLLPTVRFSKRTVRVRLSTIEKIMENGLVKSSDRE